MVRQTIFATPPALRVAAEVLLDDAPDISINEHGIQLGFANGPVMDNMACAR
jgi:hypothetical protein